MTGRELAVEFTDLWRDLESTEINQMLAKNVSYELLEFFASYARDFASESFDDQCLPEELCQRLPNLLIIGYIIRILEERVR